MSPPTPVRLQTSVWNPSGARRALLLHGLGSDGTTWWRVASSLAEDGFMVLAPDLRSHGRSPSVVDHRLEAFAEDVLLLGEGYDIVVAHSLGGAVAAGLLTRPGFAAAAVLVDPVLRIAADAREAVRAELRADVGQLDPVRLRADNPRWSERDIELKLLAAARVPASVVDAVVDDNDPFDVVPLISRWVARVHLLGADPAAGGYLDLDELGGVVDGSRVTAEQLEGVGHSIHREVPDRVLAAVTRVLDG